MRISRYLRLFFIAAIILVSVLCMTSCVKRKASTESHNYDPLSNCTKYSKWVSEDGTISFETDKYGDKYGTLTTSNGTIDIFVTDGSPNFIRIYRVEDGLPVELIERWKGYLSKDNEIIVIEKQTTTYYNQEQKIKFICVDDGKTEASE